MKKEEFKEPNMYCLGRNKWGKLKRINLLKYNSNGDIYLGIDFVDEDGLTNYSFLTVNANELIKTLESKFVSSKKALIRYLCPNCNSFIKKETDKCPRCNQIISWEAK